MTAILLAGLGFGDEGKGSVTDALIRHTGADLIIRYNGGGQCAHNVITPDGTHHTFAQFGSGMFVAGVRTYLSRFMLVDLSTLLTESEVLSNIGLHSVLRRTYVDRQAVVTTMYHKVLNKLREISRGINRHGSTAMGIGTTREMSLLYPDSVLRVGDCVSEGLMKEKLCFIHKIVHEEAHTLFSSTEGDTEIGELLRLLDEGPHLEYLWDRYLQVIKQVQLTCEPPRVRTGIVFEGAQGMLLDEKFGFQPHTTWTDITFNNALTILKEMGYSSPIHKIGVIRSYYTRHGDGPFPSESQLLKKLGYMVEEHNKYEPYTGHFRLGNFDIPLLLKALRDIGGVNQLAINHMDTAAQRVIVPVRLSEKCNAVIPYQHFVSTISEISNTPVGIVGYGPKATNKDFKEHHA